MFPHVFLLLLILCVSRDVGSHLITVETDIDSTTTPTPSLFRNSYRNVTADEYSDVVLACAGDKLKNASWDPLSLELIGTNGAITTSTDEETGAAILVLPNVTTSAIGMYVCRKSNVVEHVYLNIFTPNIHFSSDLISSEHTSVRFGRTINLTCTIKSVGLIEDVIWSHNDSIIETDQTGWQMRRRFCASKGNCILETQFNLQIENATFADGGKYACSVGNQIKPSSVYVEIIDPDHAVMTFSQSIQSDSEWFRLQILEISAEALESKGINEEMAVHIKDRLDQLDSERPWNVILGRDVAYATTHHNFYSDYRAFGFSLGSIKFFIYQTPN